MQDPAALGDWLMEKRRKEALTVGKKFSTPFDEWRTGAWGEHRSDQLVRDWMGKGATVADARRLGNEDLDLYNEYLFLQSAVEEAKPLHEERMRKEAETQSQHQQTRTNSMKR